MDNGKFELECGVWLDIMVTKCVLNKSNSVELRIDGDIGEQVVDFRNEERFACKPLAQKCSSRCVHDCVYKQIV